MLDADIGESMGQPEKSVQLPALINGLIREADSAGTESVSGILNVTRGTADFKGHRLINKTFTYRADLETEVPPDIPGHPSEYDFLMRIAEEGSPVPAEKQPSLTLKIKDGTIESIGLQGYGSDLPSHIFGWERDMDGYPTLPDNALGNLARQVREDANTGGHLDPEGEYYWGIQLSYAKPDAKGMERGPSVAARHSATPLDSGGEIFTRKLTPSKDQSELVDPWSSTGSVTQKDIEVIEGLLLNIIPQDIEWRDALGPNDGKEEYAPVKPIESNITYTAPDIKGLWEEFWRLRQASGMHTIGRSGGELLGDINATIYSYNGNLSCIMNFPDYTEIPLRIPFLGEGIMEKTLKRLREFVDPNIILDEYGNLIEGERDKMGVIKPKKDGPLYQLPYTHLIAPRGRQGDEFLWTQEERYGFDFHPEGPADFANGIGKGLDILRVALGVLYEENGLTLPKEHILLEMDKGSGAEPKALPDGSIEVGK